MFLPDYFQPPTTITKLRHQAITTWQQWQPRLQAVGFTAIGLMMIAIAATISAGQKTRAAWEWLYPRLLAAYRAFKNYQEPLPAPAQVPEPEAEELRQTNANYFPNPYEAVERELLETLISACQQPEESILLEPAPAATAPAKRRGRAKKTAPGTAKD